MVKITDIKHIFYINLDARPDRKEHIEKQLENIGLEAIRFPAIRHKIGSLGCSLSHLSLLKFAKCNNLDHIMIFEDDTTFLNPELFINNLNEFLKNGPSDYDVLLLAGNNVGKYTRVSNFCVKISKCYTTTAYLVKNTYYDILIDNFEQGIRGLIGNPKSRSYCLDEFWGQLQLRDNWYLLTPLSVIQKPDKSDIEGTYTDYSNNMLSLDKVLVKNRHNFLKFS